MKRCWPLALVILVCVHLQIALADPSPPAPQLTSAQQSRVKKAAAFAKTIDELMQKRNHQQAIPLAKEVLATCREVLGEKNLQTSEWFNNLGVLYDAVGDYALAKTCHEHALAIRKEVLGEKHPHTALSLGNLAMSLQHLGDYELARRYQEQVLAIRRETLGEKHPLTAGSYSNLGGLLCELEEYSQAEVYCEKALEIRREIFGEKHSETAAALQVLGNLRSAMGDYAGARSCHEQALAIRREVQGEKHSDTASSLACLAGVLRVMGDYGPARAYYDQALVICKQEQGENSLPVASTLQGLGSLLMAMGDYRGAQSHLEQALAIRKKVLGDGHVFTAASLYEVGFLHLRVKDYQGARPYFEEALAIRRRIQGEKHSDTAPCLTCLGIISTELRANTEARRYFEQALAIQQETLGEQHPSTACTLSQLAGNSIATGDYATARTFYEKLVSIEQEVFGNAHFETAGGLNNLALLQARLEQWPAAARSQDESRRISRRYVVRVLSGLSEREQLLYLGQQDYWLLQVGLSLGLQQRSDPEIAALSAGWLLNGKGVAQEALARRMLLTRETHDPELAAYARQTTEVRQKLAALSLSVPKPGGRKNHTLQLTKLEQEEEELSRKLAQTGSQAIAGESWIDIDDLRKKIPSDAVFVNVARVSAFNFQFRRKEERWQRDHYAAWIIPPSGDQQIKVIDLGDADLVDQAIRISRLALREATTPKASAAAAQESGPKAARIYAASLMKLSQMLLHPLVKEVGEAKELIVSPDASLWLVPWAALVLPDGRFAIQEHCIRYLVSGRELMAPPSSHATARAMIMADPSYDLTPTAGQAALNEVLTKAKAETSGQRLAMHTQSSVLSKAARLPGTALEARMVAPKLNDYTGKQPAVFLDRSALEGLFKAVHRPQIVLLSTHGFFLPDQDLMPEEKELSSLLGISGLSPPPGVKPPENPLLRCGILLAGCNYRGESEVDDGILTGMEIVGIDLRGTELVVLSACETGVGKVSTGEGVAGLRQAFQMAGAQAVLATLWQIHDQSSAVLMNDFFANMAKGQSKAESLRGAQLEMIQRLQAKSGFAHPFFWAAFTLTGQ